MPVDYPTIPAAINAASPGDTIRVSAGTYTYSRITPAAPYYTDAPIALKSGICLEGAGVDQTIITVPGTWGIYIGNNTSYVTVKDLTVKGSGHLKPGGQGVSDGGGIGIFYANNIKIESCRLTDNAENNGGGLATLFSTEVSVTRCLIDHNYAKNLGGGMSLSASSVTLTSVTLADNTASYTGYSIDKPIGGISTASPVSTTIKNSILWGNSGYDLHPPTLSGVSYSDIGTPNGGPGNIVANPLFISTSDYHLQSTSPVINAGDPSLTDADGTRSDMGVYPFLSAMPPLPPPPPPPSASVAEGQLKWVFTTAAEYNPPGAGDASIGSDGTIYVGNYTELVAINPDGTKKWAALKGTGPLSPSIGNDGTLFTPTGSLTAYALKPDGSTKWTYALSAYGLYGRPAIAGDGTIYVTDGSPTKKLYALSVAGSLKWTFATTTGIVSPPAIASDGTVYVGAAYTTTHEGSYGAVYALGPDGSIKWIFNIPKLNYILSVGGFAIGSDGTVYFGSSEGRLFALNPDGTQKWVYRMPEITVGLGAPSIAMDGTLYVPVGPSSFSTKLIALNPDGTKKWTFALPTGQYDLTTPTVGADGMLYAVSSSYGLYAINPNGTTKWTWSGTDTWGYNTPSLAPDGTIYIGSAASGKIYAVKGVSPGLANSPWPRSRKNNRFTSSVSDALTEYRPQPKANALSAIPPPLLATMLATLDALLKALQQMR